MEESLDG
ncbi:hypothetical protein L195_g026256, partial [Trifolium pratense]